MLEQIRPLFIWDSHKSVAPPIQRKAAVIQSGDGTNDAAANKRQIRSGAPCHTNTALCSRCCLALRGHAAADGLKKKFELLGCCLLACPLEGAVLLFRLFAGDRQLPHDSLTL